MPSTRCLTRRIAGLALVGGIVAGCAAEPSLPDLGRIYSEVSAANTGVDRRPLITVPGTLGSRLRDRETGRVVWGGGSRGLSADPEDPVEAALIALPILPEDVPLSALRDGVEPFGLVETVTPEVLGIPLDVDVYAGALQTLSAGGFRSETRSAIEVLDPRGDGSQRRAVTPADYEALSNERPVAAFHFDYDWRRDIPTIAREFHEFVILRKRQVAAIRSIYERRTVSPDEVSFDLLAHSMGGLVTRYYLMHGPVDLPEDGSLPPVTWEGARHFQRVVIVATPNAGSILAAENLINGKSLGPLQPFYPPGLLATHASPWQLFPRARHNRLRLGNRDGPPLNPLDPALWEKHRWGLLDPGSAELLELLLPEVEDAEERRRLAAVHQARLMRRAAQFHAAMDRWAPTPPGFETFLVVGGGFATPAAATVDPDTGSFQLTEREEGDGVVLRASVLLDERQGSDRRTGLETPLRFDQTLFLPDEHVELTKNPVFGDNLLFWLLEQPRPTDELAEPTEGLLVAAETVAEEEADAEGPRTFGAGDR